MFCMFTKRGEYAHKAAMALAVAGNGNGYVKAKDLAEKESIPLPFLKKLIAALKQRGIVDTRTGKQGGVVLRKDPTKVSLLDIVHAVEKEPTLSSCPFPAKQCTYRQLCGVSAEWSRLVNELTETMRKVSLADLMRTKNEVSALHARS